MKKFTIVTMGLLFAAALVLVGTGCSLFGPSVDEVAPGVLDSFEGDLPTTEEDALQVLGSAVTGAGMSVGSDQDLQDDLDRELADGVEGWEDPAAQTLAYKMINSLYSGQLQPKDITADGSFEESADGKTGKMDASLTITNEEVSGSTGTITLDFDGSVDGEGGEDSDSVFFAEAKGQAEGSMEMDNFSNSEVGDYTVDGPINMAAKFDESFDYKADGKIYIDYKTYFEIAAGLSISSSTYGGKFIFSFKIDQNVSGLVIDLEDYYGSSSEYEAPEEVSLTMSLKIYDNNNDEVASYKYTEDDSDKIAPIFMGMFETSY